MPGCATVAAIYDRRYSKTLMYALLDWGCRRDDPQVEFVHTRWTGPDRFHCFIEIFSIRCHNVDAAIFGFDNSVALGKNDIRGLHIYFPCA